MPSGEFCRYAIDYSCDRINWTELCEKTDDLESPDSGDCYHADINARYIRITLTYCSSGDAVTLEMSQSPGALRHPRCGGQFTCAVSHARKYLRCQRRL